MADDATPPSLQERIQRLEDLEEIRNLYIDYGRHLDAGDPEAYAALYARDAKLRLGPIMKADGRDNIKEAATKIMRPSADGSRRSVHLLASPRIELHGDTATGECVWSAVSAAEGGTKILVGRHIDELVREEGRWRIDSRRGVLDVGAF